MRKIFPYLLIVLFCSCKKNNPEPEVPDAFENGLVILNEGLYQQNNSSLSFFSMTDQEVHQQVFLKENGRGLGDTANDMDRYLFNGKYYLIIVVDVSSQVEIVEASTLKSVVRIPVFDGEVGRQPRFVGVSDDKAFSCNYDGTVSVIDLNTNEITNTIEVGKNPDGLAISGNYLYIGNSGGLDAPDYDSTVSIINIETEMVETTLDVRMNMRRMLVDDEGDVYVISRGNYSTVAPAIIRIDASTNTVEGETEVPLLDWTYSDNWIYYYDQDLDGIYRYNTLTETLENEKIIDCSDHDLVYKVEVLDDFIYTMDANGYVNSSTIRCYNLLGDFQYSFTAGLNSNTMIQND